MTGFRSDHAGALIDRARPVNFHWHGQAMTGLAGDTLASALLANGIVLAGRSFKYHRPRGLLAAGVEEPNILVQVGEGGTTSPNIKATTVRLVAGLKASAVNCYPSPRFDLLAFNQILKPLLPAAFYYKTFKWPDWHLFEPAIRKIAGLGIAPSAPDPDIYSHLHMAVDVLVVGGGRSGMRAALEAAEAGSSVLLADQEQFWGGSSLARSADTDAEITAMLATLKANARVRMMPRTTVFGAYDHLCFGLLQETGKAQDGAVSQRLIKLRCNRAVIATGAIERPLLFQNNDLPGIMLASAAHAYLLRQAIVPGRQIIVVTNNDSGWNVALDFARMGHGPYAILDTRENSPSGLREEAHAAGIRLHWAVKPQTALGRKEIRGFQFQSGAQTIQIPCDSLLVSGGFNPVVHLHSQAGGSLEWNQRCAGFVPAACVTGIVVVGRAAGHGLPACAPIDVGGSQRPWRADKVWVDLQNDVTVADIELAARESFCAVEHLKRYTTLGMGTDQGKTSNVNGLAVMGELLGKAPQEIGTTKFRPPYEPIRVGAFAGRYRGTQLDPPLRLPAHEMHLRLGARMAHYGPFLRPEAYGKKDESLEAAICREVLSVRKGVGLFDASPLGKLEIHGPDAGRLIDLCVVSTMSTLQPGNCRYTLSCNEKGIVIDDGVVVRRPDGSFILGTSSAGTDRIRTQIEEHLQCHWQDLKAVLIDVTSNWAVLTLAGPLARTILQLCPLTIDVSSEAFPHLAYREGLFGDWPVRISRVSYSGELSYEIAIAADKATLLAEYLLSIGGSDGLVPFGIEALEVLRIEKGFAHIGTETDGATMPQDLGYETVLERKKSDFIGRRAAKMAVGAEPRRKKLVGLEALDNVIIPPGAHVLPKTQSPGSDGWVTSSAFCPTIGKPHALAMVADGLNRMGEIIELWDIGADNNGRSFPARIVPACAFDPEGNRMRHA